MLCRVVVFLSPLSFFCLFCSDHRRSSDTLFRCVIAAFIAKIYRTPLMLRKIIDRPMWLQHTSLRTHLCRPGVNLISAWYVACPRCYCCGCSHTPQPCARSVAVTGRGCFSRQPVPHLARILSKVGGTDREMMHSLFSVLFLLPCMWA